MLKNRPLIRRITICAVMAALAILLCRILGFPPTGAYRIEISFLPIAVIAMLYGPVWSGICYAAADLIGAAILTGINPFITLCKLLFGVLMGLVFYKKRRGPLGIILFFLLAGVLVDICCMTPIFVYQFGYTWKAALIYRAIGFAVNTPVRILLMILIEPRLAKFFPTLTEKKESD